MSQIYMKKEEEKTQSITISHAPLTRTLAINDGIIEQVMQIDYLGRRLISSNRTDEEKEHQLAKPRRIDECMNNHLIWNNNCLLYTSRCV